METDYYRGLYRVYIGGSIRIMEKKMETHVYIGIMEKNMETIM